jgi:hypothetical protein
VDERARVVVVIINGARRTRSGNCSMRSRLAIMARRARSVGGRSSSTASEARLGAPQRCL